MTLRQTLSYWFMLNKDNRLLLVVVEFNGPGMWRTWALEAQDPAVFNQRCPINLN